MEILAMLAPPDHQSSIEMGDSPRFSDGSKKSLKTGNPGRGRLKGKAVVKENLLAIGKLKASQGEQGLARAYRKVVKDVGQRAARHPLPE